jgi:hypothetical protein
MKKCYIRVIVHDDGDNELTRLELESKEVDRLRGPLNTGELYFEAQTEIPVLRNELVSYGHEEKDIDEAIAHVLGSCNGDECIVGKI